MSIRLYDSLTQGLVDFNPLVPGRVSMYVCGPTVQSEPHIGHLRSALVYDLWSRWFSYRGYQVTMVRNVTDIDDKILEKAEKEPWWALASRVERLFHQATDALRIQPPTLEPRATGDIPAMIALISTLIDKGHAYVADDQSGDVYFDVSSWSEYGALTRQHPDDMEPAAEGTSQKRSPHDFALWKGHKDSEPDTAQWPAPWGSGRPGWHLECSAMSARYLGTEFDIHGGGLDLRFPHHENELAQSRAAGHPFAHYWLHSALVTVGGKKMSKSLGNSILAGEWLAHASPMVIRYALTTAHYRSSIDLHEGVLEESASALARITGFLDRTKDLSGERVLPESFAEAMDDDLSIPVALAVIHDTVREGNQALDDGYSARASIASGQVREMLECLGLNPESDEWAADRSDVNDDYLGALMSEIVSAREAARESKNFELSDSLRDIVDRAGIELTDTAEGTEWSPRGR